MSDFIILEGASLHEGTGGVLRRDPDWVDVEDVLVSCFTNGGRAKLILAEEDFDRRIGYGTFLGMDAHPGECLVLFCPWSNPPGLLRRRNWWQNGPKEGVAEFNDFDFDNRMVCRDLGALLEFFKDFCANHDLSEIGLSSTDSGRETFVG